ncbi:hypothetical protein GW781_01060 [bacterium]|nr:hypothetical protein [bacterium]
MESETKYAKFAKVLWKVVENGRLTLGTVEELENEIDFEAREQGLSKDEIEQAIEYAKEHYTF